MMISVVIPVYNAESFLDKSIGSVINQTYKQIELILVNGESTDNSKKICEKYARFDKRIKVIYQENRGPSAARNAGVDNAKGEFVFFLDADDFIEENTFETLIETYRKYHPDLVMSNFSKLENNGEIKKQEAIFRPKDVPFKGKVKVLSNQDIADYTRHFLKHPSNHLISYCWAKLYKLAIIKENRISANEDLHLFEDFVFNLDYFRYVDTVAFVNKSLYTYVMHNNYVSASMAIINSERLLHDMNIFKAKSSDFFQQAKIKKINNADIDKEIGHALIHYIIIFMVRSCRQITNGNKKRIYDEIDKLINNSFFRSILKYYSPSKGNSKILPMLMKLKLINLLMLICKYKANKRYGKLEGSEYVK